MAPPTQTNFDRATTDDHLGFDLYVRGIVRKIRDATKGNQLPLTIGIYGRWGSGKTSLMRMVEAQLAGPPQFENEEAQKAQQRRVRWLLLVQGLWTVALAMALVTAPSVAGALAIRFPALNGSAGQALTGWLACLFGMLGGLVRSLFDTWWHGSVERDLSPRRAILSAARAPVALVVGAVVLAALAAWTGLPAAIAGRPFLEILLDLLVAVAAFAGVPASVRHRLLAPVLAGRFGPALRDFVSRRVAPRQATSDHGAGAGTPQVQVIWFNAWRYAQEKELWATLLHRLLTDLEVNARGERRIRIKWALWWRSISWKNGAVDVARKLTPTVGKALAAVAAASLAVWLSRLAVSPIAEGVLRQAAGTVAGLVSTAGTITLWLRENVATPLADIDFDKYRKKSSYRDHLGFLTEFSEELNAITTIARGAGNPIVLMLDDLDRCLPEQAVSVLEAIKHFVSEEAPVVFVIGADREFIERAIDVRYRAFKDDHDPLEHRKERFAQMGHEYLEKIVQLPFNLPPIEVDRIDQFIDDRFSEYALVKDNSGTFAAGLPPNPRQVLRVVDTFRFVAGLADESGHLYSGTILPPVLVKLVIIQYRWPDLYADTVERPELLAALERFFKGTPLPSDEILKDLRLRHEAKSGLRKLLTVEAGSLTGVNLAPYLFLTARAQAQGPVEGGLEASAAGNAPPTAVQVDAKPEMPPVPQPPPPPAAAAPPVAVEAPAAPVDAALVLERERLDQLVAQLTSGGGDSAVLSRLLEVRVRIDAMLASNAVGEAQMLLNESLEMAERAAHELAMAGERRGAEIAAKVGDGRIIFQTAIRYAALEIQALHAVDTEGSGKVRYTLIDRHKPETKWTSDYPGRDLMAAAVQFQNGTASEQEVNLLEDALFESHLRMLGPAIDARSRRRIRLVNESPTLDDLPWELMRLRRGKEKGATPIGLDPRHSFVRGLPQTLAPPGRSARLSPMTIALIAQPGAELSTSDAQSRLATLKHAFAPLEESGAVHVVLQESPSQRDFEEALREEPAILHFVSGNDNLTNGISISGGTIPLDIFSPMLMGAGVGVVILEAPRSWRAARTLGVDVQAVVGFQSVDPSGPEETFGLAFHRAFFRSGQADFAITEGRRALAAVMGDKYWMALSPVLYQHVTETGMVFDASLA